MNADSYNNAIIEVETNSISSKQIYYNFAIY